MICSKSIFLGVALWLVSSHKPHDSLLASKVPHHHLQHLSSCYMSPFSIKLIAFMKPNNTITTPKDELQKQARILSTCKDKMLVLSHLSNQRPYDKATSQTSNLTASCGKVVTIWISITTANYTCRITIAYDHYAKKATIHQVTTMLATSIKIPFPGNKHLLTIGADDPLTLIITLTGARPIKNVRSSAPVVSRWLWPGKRTFLEVVSMVVTWWIVAFLPSAYIYTGRYCNYMISSPRDSVSLHQLWQPLLTIYTLW